MINVDLHDKRTNEQFEWFVRNQDLARYVLIPQESIDYAEIMISTNEDDLYVCIEIDEWRSCLKLSGAVVVDLRQSHKSERAGIARTALNMLFAQKACAVPGGNPERLKIEVRQRDLQGAVVSTFVYRIVSEYKALL